MSEDEVSICIAEPNDAENLIRALKQLTNESDTFTVDHSLSQISIKDQQRQIMLINQTRDNIILIAKLHNDKGIDKIIGLVTIQQINDTQCGELGVAVLKNYWNQGIATALIEESVYWGATYSNLNDFYLIVKKDNFAAVHLYKKMGFKQSKKRFIKMNNNLKSTYKMHYSIKK
ncbi:GNAT family N-acetyltransferase [Apilactobacillus sp. TMW 2.2459]|uniref:GNAT family N-acetyltransferase n=1 Tax=Apilactobacillus xinyiensis TaxID=2841032 RepID=UPI00200F8BEC|nr:GNAT family N-acetyltransferase [Apilactobacillus xinyiensis]MCL0311507.1 GNAT family N-acetyltransferase [Apilactobacillus xinyiensis]